MRGAAEAQFAWEDATFDAARRNWPDFRELAAGNPAAGPPGFMTAWCHGAAGIALSRLRAAQVDPRRAESYLPAARAGLATTLERLDAAGSEPDSEECLCHGICGLAEVALIGGRVLGEARPRRQVLAAMEKLARRRTGSAPGSPVAPALFTGEAGIGFAMLRLNDPVRVPTVLLPGAGA